MMKGMNLGRIPIVLTLIAGIVGCQMFDDSPTEVGTNAAGSSVLNNFIMGAPELDTWGAYYEEGESFVRIDIPVAGAIKVKYSATSGWSGAIFVLTDTPVGLEIGLVERDGVVDVVQDVCVSYVEGGTFTSMPSNVEETMHGDWTHYLRIADDASTRNWWPANAGFEFSGAETSACGVVNSKLQWEMIPGGAFDKPAASSTAPSSPTSPPSSCPSVPAACVVQNTNDSGAGSLRRALADLGASGCSTLTFADAIVGQTIALSSETLLLDSDVTIDGCTGMTIDGNNTMQVLRVNSGVTATLDALKITGGSYFTGGGISNEGALTIGSATMVSDNTARFGGGISNWDTGTLTVYGAVSNNTATDGDGGGIRNDGGGTVTIYGEVNDNTANDSGGGIDNYDDSTVTVYGEVSGNTANDSGGGINNEDDSTVTVYGEVSNNTANGDGGGIRNHRSTLTVYGTVSGNNTVTYSGGGINNRDGTLTLDGAVISNNMAEGSGGGIYNYHHEENEGMITIGGNVKVENNNSSYGGGVYAIGDGSSCDDFNGVAYSGNSPAGCHDS